MKFKTLIAAFAMTAGTAIAVPAAAQVQGNIAVVNAPLAVAQATALGAAYQQIATTYQTQRTTIQQRQQRIQAILTQLDTNGDGNLDENEQRAAQNTPQATELTQIENEVSGLQQQIDRARVYAVEQILRQYGPIVQQVVNQNNIQLVLAPDSVIFAQPAADITPQVVTALNAAVPSVQSAPPADWQPARQSVQLFQQVQQILAAVAAQQQQQQQTTGDSRM